MVSDFVNERNGYLSLTNEEFDKASQTNPDIMKQARCLLLYGEPKEGRLAVYCCMVSQRRAGSLFTAVW